MGYTVVEDPRGFVHVVFLGCVAEVDRSLAMDDATAALVSKGRSRLLVDFSKATLRNASAVQSGSPPPASGTHCKVAVVSPLELEGGQVDKANACSFRDVDTAIDWLVKDG